MVVCTTVLVLARPQRDLTLGYGDLIRDGNTAMVVTAGAYEDVTGGCVPFSDRQRFTGYAAAATAGSGRARVIGVDGDTTGHFTSRGHDWFGGDLGFAICRQRF